MKTERQLSFYAAASSEQVLRELETSNRGLSEREAAKRLLCYGHNLVTIYLIIVEIAKRIFYRYNDLSVNA